MTRVDNEIIIEDAKLIWRNFAGEEGTFNAKGKRNFSVRLDQVLAEQLERDGWNIKTKPPREEGDEPLYHLPVTVNFDGPRPPRIMMITKSRNNRTPLDEDTVGLLDYAEFDLVDIILRPYNWDVQGKQGVKAYLKTGYFTIREDELEIKYAHIPDAGQLAIENVIEVEVEEDSGWAAEDHKELER